MAFSVSCAQDIGSGAVKVRFVMLILQETEGEVRNFISGNMKRCLALRVYLMPYFVEATGGSGMAGACATGIVRPGGQTGFKLIQEARYSVESMIFVLHIALVLFKYIFLYFVGYFSDCTELR